jgi:hypothetical protein
MNMLIKCFPVLYTGMIYLNLFGFLFRIVKVENIHAHFIFIIILTFICVVINYLDSLFFSFLATCESFNLRLDNDSYLSIANTIHLCCAVRIMVRDLGSYVYVTKLDLGN